MYLQNKSNFCKVFGTVQMLFFSSHFKLKKKYLSFAKTLIQYLHSVGLFVP